MDFFILPLLQTIFIWERWDRWTSCLFHKPNILWTMMAWFLFNFLHLLHRLWWINFSCSCIWTLGFPNSIFHATSICIISFYCHLTYIFFIPFFYFRTVHALWGCVLRFWEMWKIEQTRGLRKDCISRDPEMDIQYHQIL